MRTIVIVCMCSIELAAAGAQEPPPSEALAAPAGAGYYVPARFPDVRLERALERADSYDLMGDEERALGTVEALADMTLCPPLLWDTDTAHAVAQGLRGLDNPHDHQGAFHGGIALVVIGGLTVLGTVAATLGLLFESLGCAFSYCTASEFPAMALIGTGVAGGTVMITGFLVWLIGEEMLNTGARRFEERRGALRQRLVADLEENEPGVPFPAFGRAECR